MIASHDQHQKWPTQEGKKKIHLLKIFFKDVSSFTRPANCNSFRVRFKHFHLVKSGFRVRKWPKFHSSLNKKFKKIAPFSNLSSHPHLRFSGLRFTHIVPKFHCSSISTSENHGPACIAFHCSHLYYISLTLGLSAILPKHGCHFKQLFI